MRTLLIWMLALAAAPALADEAAARRWIDQEFQPSTLSKEQQLAELKWFIGAAAQLKAQGVAFATEADETTTGPAHFMVLDPDGNPILVDQHR